MDEPRMVIRRDRLHSYIRNILVLTVGIPIIVFGTYGTYNGGTSIGETVYLKFAFPAAILVLLALLSKDLARRPRITLYPFGVLELQCLSLIFLLILIGTLRSPQYVLSVSITSFAALLGIVYIVNHIRDRAGFKSAFRSYQVLIYGTSILALLSGAYSFHIGSFTIGPLLIEYNTIYWRVNSWYVTSTGMGLFFCQGLYAAYYLASRTSSVVIKAMHGLVSIGFIYGMILTGGRTGFIVLVLSAFGLWVARSRPSLATVMKFLVVCGCLWALGSFVFTVFADEVLLLRRFQDGDTSTFGGRADFMERALGDIGRFTASQFLLGVGVNGVRETLHWEVSAHSGMLRFLLEYGLLMVVTYLVLSVTAIWRIFQILRKEPETQVESSVLFLSMSTYFLAEFMVIQLFGVSIEFLMYITVLAFSIVLRKVFDERRDGGMIPE